jgi:hypothetical protein
MADAVEKEGSLSRAQEYTERELVHALLAKVEGTDDRERLRWLDSQMRQLSARARWKMGVRPRRRSAPLKT